MVFVHKFCLFLELKADQFNFKKLTNQLILLFSTCQIEQIKALLIDL